MPNLLTPRSGLGVAVLNGKLYAVGGHDGKESLSSVERLDLASGQWERVRDMNRARWYGGVCVVDGSLYAAGGDNGRSVERYDDKANTWHLVIEMQKIDDACRLVVL